MDHMKHFLHDHPSEAVLMRVKEEYEPDKGALPFQEIWDKYMKKYGDLFVEKLDDIPSLGEVRGRILLLRDAGGMDEYGIPFQGKLTNIQDDYEVKYEDRLLPGKGITVGEKIDKIHEKIECARFPDGNPDCGSINDIGEKRLVINHSSANGAYSNATPLDVAKDINPTLICPLKHMSMYLHKPQHIGVIVMDFPSEALIAAILLTNFLH